MSITPYTPPCPISHSALVCPDAVAIETDSLIFSYKELEEAVAARAKQLSNLGIQSGMRIAFIAKGDFTTVLTLFALFRLEAAAALLSFREPESSINQKIEQLQAHYLLENSLNGPRLIPKNEKGPKNSAKIATMLFTSGSSGKAKIACHSLSNFLTLARSANERSRLKRDDLYLLSLPLFHVGGIALLIRTFLAGSSLRISEKKPGDIATSHLSLVPTQLRDLLKNGRHYPRFVLLGGAPIPPDLVEEAKLKGIAIYKTYGMTEMSSQICTALPEGALLPLSCAEVGLAEDGEIFVKGEGLFLGYWPELRAPIDSDGFFHTGDLGKWDKDGGLCYLGRKDRLFISGGENIQPEEVEEILRAAFPEREIWIVPIDDARYGKRAAALFSGELPTLAQVEKALADMLPKYKWPVAVAALPEIGGGIKRSAASLAAISDSLVARG